MIQVPAPVARSQDLFQFEGVGYVGDGIPEPFIPAPEGQGVLGIIGEAALVQHGAYEEDPAPIRFPRGCHLCDPVRLGQSHPGVPPDPGGEFRLARSHGTDDQDAASGAGEVKVLLRIVNGQGGKSQAFQKILRLLLHGVEGHFISPYSIRPAPDP